MQYKYSHKMKFINDAHNWPPAAKFEDQFSDKVDELFPELKDKEIDIAEFNQFKLQFCLDRNSPLQVFIKDKNNGVERVERDAIIYVDELYEDIDDEKHIYALIAHEIGHLAEYYRGEERNDTEGEIIADKAAFDIGLGQEMLGVLNDLRQSAIQKQEKETFNFLNGLDGKKTICQFDERIENMEKLLKGNHGDESADHSK